MACPRGGELTKKKKVATFLYSSIETDPIRKQNNQKKKKKSGDMKSFVANRSLQSIRTADLYHMHKEGK